MLRVVMTSQVIKKGESNEQGMILGVMSSIMSLSMIIGPILAGILFSIKLNLPFFASAALAFLAFLILFLDINHKRNLEIKVDDEELEIAEQKIEFIS